MATKVEEELALLEQRFADAEAQWSVLQAKLATLDMSGACVGEETGEAIEAIEAIPPRGAAMGAVGSFAMRA